MLEEMNDFSIVKVNSPVGAVLFFLKHLTLFILPTANYPITNLLKDS